MIEIVELRTARLFVKKISRDDIDDFVEWKIQEVYHEFLSSKVKTREEYEKSIESIKRLNTFNRIAISNHCR